MKAVVLAAGQGTRLRPLTDDKPKALVEVADRPILSHCFDQLIGIGADELLVVVGYKKEKLIEHYGDSYDDVPITYAHQREPQGLAHALLTVEEHIDDAATTSLMRTSGTLSTASTRTAPTRRFLSKKSPTRMLPDTASATPTTTARSSRSLRNPTTRRRIS